VYLGWWIVGSDVISRNNHEPIMDSEHEYLFWYAFEQLAPYTISGEENMQRTHRTYRFYQRHTAQMLAS